MRAAFARVRPAFVGGLVLALSATLGWLPARADDAHDHDRAREAAAAGDVMPLRQVLDKLAQVRPGEVMEVELEREGGRWIYEIKLLERGGRLRKLVLDARTAEVLKDKLRPTPSAGEVPGR